MNYLVVRVDGDHILPGGYVRPGGRKREAASMQASAIAS